MAITLTITAGETKTGQFDQINETSLQHKQVSDEVGLGGGARG